MRMLPVHGYEDRYLVSDCGEVFSIRLSRKLHKNLSGKSKYYSVMLTKNGIQKRLSVHRLVASAFLEKTGDTVNHLDGNKLNNSMSNLQWVSRSENTFHAWAIGLHDTTRAALKEKLTGRPSPKKGKTYAKSIAAL